MSNGLTATVAGTVKLLLAAGGLFTLVYFGVRLGTGESQVATTAEALRTHEVAAVREHQRIETVTTERVNASRDLLFAELRAINARLERIERKLP